ncbi:Cof-type HAD-IIB family hydrolase [Alkalibacterium sp. s-m-22]|uniref:Cof-type HAD-IIB family hydrolase n=1 Tax=Alkalibacterium indicireducens TaxID=398758 RepID=A0ABP3KRF7_9LACT
MVDMTSRKLFVFDIDGTLLDEHKQLPESTRQAVKKLAENYEVAIATGRNRTMASEVIKELAIENYIVCNGAAAYYKHDSIYTNSLNKDELDRLITMADDNGHQMVYETVDELRRRSSQPNERMEKGMAHVGFPVPEQNHDYHEKYPLVQCLIFYSEEEASLYEEGQFDHFRFVRWHETGVDVLPAGGSKFSTIERLAKQLNISNDNIVAFGDGFNDLEMIENAGTGVAMGNAEDDVKKVADLVTASSSQNGIQLALEKLGYL